MMTMWWSVWMIIAQGLITMAKTALVTDRAASYDLPGL